MKHLRKALIRLLIGIIVIAGGTIAWLYEPEPGADAPLVIVSVDNSLWNRIGLNRLTYVRLLRLEGLRPVLVDFDADASTARANELLSDARGLVLTGGGDVAARYYNGEADLTRGVKPARDALELMLLDAADRESLPVLGLCRGAQLLNVYFGGTLGDFRSETEKYDRHMAGWPGHAVTIDEDSRLADIFGRSVLDAVTTWHGQFVDSPGTDVRIVARSPDGTPEAIEIGTSREFGMLGVQWHAEMPPWDEAQRPLFTAFAAAVRQHE